ncbi:MAG: 4Fe-4S dicluster domain-containing protein [Anaerolineae bacterium]|jgi:heterodisulfide reductase subunit C
MPEETPANPFLEEVMAIPGGERLKSCIQCGTCGGSCPSGFAMDHTPRELFAMILAGMREEVLKSNTFWFCVSCYYCTIRCPQEIPITDIMYRLKQLAVEAGYYTASITGFSETFVGQVETYGRSFELGLATGHYLRHHPLQSIRMSPLMVSMVTRGRMSFTPKRIQGIRQLRAILRRAKEVAKEEGW